MTQSGSLFLSTPLKGSAQPQWFKGFTDAVRAQALSVDTSILLLLLLLLLLL